MIVFLKDSQLLLRNLSTEQSWPIKDAGGQYKVHGCLNRVMKATSNLNVIVEDINDNGTFKVLQIDII